MSETYLPSSFRDPNGRLFQRDGVLYRAIDRAYAAHYDRLMASGLYQKLVDERLMVEHEDVAASVPGADAGRVYRVIRPRMVPFISYPYEWCAGQLRAAALATLRLQRLALEHGMTLKDASAYNIQFVENRPTLIDTLSFEVQPEPRPWVAYQQFCKHFLAPLLLIEYRDERLGQLSRRWIDGVPLDLASELLPWRTRLSFSIQTHIHLHARMQNKYSDTHGGLTKPKAGATKISAAGLTGLLDNLESLVRGLNRHVRATEWSDYYNDTNYTKGGLDHKRDLVGRFLDASRPALVWDIGANNGFFSRVAAEKGIDVISMDYDHGSVEANYRQCLQEKQAHVLPLLVDLTNPPGGIGWNNRERMSLLDRGPADVALALALIHHLAIAFNVPFDMQAPFFAGAARRLVIEFVPKEDSQVQRLLQGREDVFVDYTRPAFDAAFGRYFNTIEAAPIQDSGRVLYLMEKKS